MSTGQVLAPEAQDLLTQCCSPGRKNDYPVSYFVVPKALSREGNNLGAASLYCVLLFPKENGASLVSRERQCFRGGSRYVCLCFSGISDIWRN